MQGQTVDPLPASVAGALLATSPAFHDWALVAIFAMAGALVALSLREDATVKQGLWLVFRAFFGSLAFSWVAITYLMERLPQDYTRQSVSIAAAFAIAMSFDWLLVQVRRRVPRWLKDFRVGEPS